jgi:hypothetical protein
MKVDFDHSGVGRHFEDVQAVIARRRVAFDDNGQVQLLPPCPPPRRRIRGNLPSVRTGGMNTCKRPWRGSTHKAVRTSHQADSPVAGRTNARKTSSGPARGEYGATTRRLRGGGSGARGGCRRGFDGGPGRMRLQRGSVPPAGPARKDKDNRPRWSKAGNPAAGGSRWANRRGSGSIVPAQEPRAAVQQGFAPFQPRCKGST